MTRKDDATKFAEEMEVVRRLVADRGPISLDEILDATKMPQWVANEYLTHLLLAGDVRPARERRRNRMVTTYQIKEKG